VTEKRVGSVSGSIPAKADPKGAESIARLSDHLGRLLAHADKLLAEWQAHADGLRARWDGEARLAGESLHRALEAALADAAQVSAVQLQRAFGANAEGLRADLERARQAAADLEAHMQRLAGGAKPTSVDELRAALAGISRQLGALQRGGARGAPWTLILAATANLLVAAVLALLWWGGRPTPAAVAPPPAPVVVAVVPDAPLAPSPPSRLPCEKLAVEPGAVQLAGRCIAELCAVKADLSPKEGTLAKPLATCKREDAVGHELLAALRTLERDRTLYRLACALPDKDADGRVTVTVRWLLDCALSK
jgi:hypothetical protein